MNYHENKADALYKCLILWEMILHVRHKTVAYEALKLRDDTMHCPCCSYVLDYTHTLPGYGTSNPPACAMLCPIDWPGTGGCNSDGSPYNQYLRNMNDTRAIQQIIGLTEQAIERNIREANYDIG